LFFISTGAGWSEVFQHPLSAIPDLVVASLVIGLVEAIAAYRRRSAWRSVLKFTGNVQGVATDQGIEWRTQHSSSKFEWGQLLKAHRERDLSLVFYAPRCAFYFPQEFFASEQEWISFNDLLDSKLAK
jgi:hypothetical protein